MMSKKTGHLEFDAQTTVLLRGNVVLPTQFGSYIRPYGLTEDSMGNTVEPGVLQTEDLNRFEAYPERNVMPLWLRNIIKDLGKKDFLILYKFFNKNQYKDVVTHGYILASADHQFLQYFYTGPTKKSKDILRYALTVVCDDAKPEWIG